MPATPAWPPRSAPRLFVEQEIVEGAILQIEGNQAHYLNRVMRIATGDAVIVCDDITGEWACEVVEVGKRHVQLAPRDRLRERESVPDFWLCPALLKKDRFDLVLEKACELGVAQIMPVITRRCVADKLNPERARTIVTEAAEQCARTALPEIAAPESLDTLLRDWPEDRCLFFADELGGEPASEVFLAERGRPAALLIGPEGGFDDAERDAIRALPQARAITLGPRILRGETASIAATAIWMSFAGDWNNSLA
ncbi:16S rRNA (uracil(1498)-N(3))-methyltransferase [Porphyrobacter algicida]|uniref:Ribosomal RNA small subunit methyltransferase E n=1 Tax=Qipengyuania algicida TaxID=1836209 RepID=A0A845AKY0_9SPHN|nr:16S rRNA (uracil(1498)-N(3))-methyltransferase [Qipengyuania algicida]MXP30067.1 16S rRNA (uracil(1498)-N(3))-methyltransferase [Qipengyuania algicida]